MLIMVAKGIRSGICHTIYQQLKAHTKYIKHYSKTEESSYLTYWNKNNLYGWTISQKLPLGGSK